MCSSVPPPRQYHTPTTPQGVVGTVPRTHHSSGGQGDCYIHTDIHTCIHRYIHRQTYKHYIHTYTKARIRTYVHTYVHTYLPTYLHTCIHAYMHPKHPTTTGHRGEGGNHKKPDWPPIPIGEEGGGWPTLDHIYSDLYTCFCNFHVFLHIQTYTFFLKKWHTHIYIHIHTVMQKLLLPKTLFYPVPSTKPSIHRC